MSRFKNMGSDLTLNWGDDLQENFDIADAELTSMQSQITTNEVDIEAKLQAHKDASAAHDAAKLSYSGAVAGATTIKQAIDTEKSRVDNIVANAGSGNTEIVDARMGADNLTRANLGTLVREIHAQQIAAAVQTTALKHGWNYVLASEDSPLNPTIYGRTLVNLLGNDGNCEDTSKWLINGGGVTTVLDSTNKVVGTNSFKITQPTAANSPCGIFKDISIDNSKYYILIAEQNLGTMANCSLRASRTDFTTIKESNIISSGSSSFVRNYVKLTPTDLTGLSALRIYARYVSTASLPNYGYVDGIRLYEIDSATYAKIDVDPEYTGDRLAEKFPYVDSIKHVTNPVITKSGKNLLPPFTEWTLHANAVATEPYKLTLNATVQSQFSYSPYVPVLPNTTYTCSSTNTNSGQIALEIYDKNLVYITAVAVNPYTMPSNAAYVRGRVGNATPNAAATGTFTFINPQLELGSVASSFEPRNDNSIMASVVLASNLDGSVKDSLSWLDGAWRKTKRWVTDSVLDGSLNWAFNADCVGYKAVYFPAPSGAKPTATFGDESTKVVKYTGTIVPNGDSGSGADKQYINGSNNNFYISVADLDSGWGEDYTPSATEIKAYFYGWKMNNGTFGTPYNGSGTKTWTLWNATNNTGAVTTTPTTLANGYTPYNLSYQLAATKEEVVPIEGAISLHSGGNQVSVDTGVIVREKVTPMLGTSGANVNYYYFNTKGHSSIPDNPLKNRSNAIIAIYKNGVVDKKWKITANNSISTTYGGAVAELPKADFDPTAEYTVTYLALDKYAMTTNVIDVIAEYNSNAKMAQDQLVRRMADAETNISINVNAIAELYKRVKSLGG